MCEAILTVPVTIFFFSTGIHGILEESSVLAVGERRGCEGRDGGER